MATCLIGLSGVGAADDRSAPLSAIDWLDQAPEALIRPVAQPEAARDEPAVAQSGASPSVTVAPLDDGVARRVGLLPYAVTGLRPDLWNGSDPEQLGRLLRAATSQRLPAAQELLLTLLLAEAERSPQDDLWLAARIDALIRMGAVEPALSLIQQTDPQNSKALFARWLTLSLLAKQEQTPCRILADKPALRPDAASHVFCTAQSGDYNTAALVFGTAGALDVLSETQEQLLARFLDPELFEDSPMPRAPVRPDALTFRLFEAAGEPLSTAPLPLAFAHHDLSADAGWKAQLEAAERLARAGVLPSNQLLGLYSSRAPAASGGLWDRVAALQAFERALDDGDTTAISTALPSMWRGMQAAGLEVAFSDLFAETLTQVEIATPTAARIAFRMELLSRAYEAAIVPDIASPADRFLMSVARGAPDPKLAGDAVQRSVVAGFGGTLALSADLETLRAGTVGANLLSILDRLADAGRGDHVALGQSLTDLRALGLEDVARRAALQFLILKADV